MSGNGKAKKVLQLIREFDWTEHFTDAVFLQTTGFVEADFDQYGGGVTDSLTAQYVRACICVLISICMCDCFSNTPGIRE